jgi:hypothetical protein
MRLLRDPGELQRSGRKLHYEACEDCRDQLDLYRRVQTFLQRESDFGVPDKWVTRVIKFFEANERAKSSTASSKTFGWLVFDSLLANGAGIRTPSTRAATERHLIWESARFRVDLLIDSADSEQAVIIGQLAARRASDESDLDGAIVEVMSAEDVFTGVVNSAGEFIVPVGRLLRGSPMEVQFTFEGELALVLLVLS